MIPLKPITYQGKTYDQYAVSLNSSPIPRGAKGYTTAVNLVLTPMFKDSDGIMHLIPSDAVDENNKSYIERFSTADIRACNNPAAQQAFYLISGITEKFAISQGWCSISNQE